MKGYPEAAAFKEVREYLEHCSKNGHPVHLFYLKYLETEAYEAYNSHLEFIESLDDEYVEDNVLVYWNEREEF